jgi:hypothetical protein
MGLAEQLTELERQQSAGDTKFWTGLTLSFELRIPPSLAQTAGSPVFFFPLVIPPENYSMDEEFGVEATYTQAGGIYAEESGLVRRTIRISGTTGFAPKGKSGGYGATSLSAKFDNRTWGRELRSVNLRKLSGQRHFHYLQDAVFRMYGDLVRDPSYAPETQMIFHNYRDEEAWLVTPKMFRLTRDKSDRVLYRYEIELLVIAPATLLANKDSTDASILDELRNTAQSIRDAIGMAQGAIDELTAVGQELENVVTNFTGIINNVSAVVDAAQDFVNGVTDIINIPFTVVTQTVDLIENSLQTVFELEEAGYAAYNLPLHTLMKIRTLSDSLERLGVNPSDFRQPLDKAISDLRGYEDPFLTLSDSQVGTSSQPVTPGSLAEVAALGTQTTTGDVSTARAKGKAGREVRAYTGGRYQTIRAGDTLVSLASRYLGNGRLWTYLAAANGLHPPFLSDQAGADLTRADSPFRGALTIGDRILIPDFSQPVERSPTPAVLGVRPEATSENKLMGRDIALVVVGGRPGATVYGAEIDTESGGGDARQVAGFANLAQAMTLRLRTDRGTDQLYREVGLTNVIGTKNVIVDYEASKSSVVASLTQDPRVALARNVTLVGEGDTLAIEATLEIRGWDSGERVRIAP